VPDGLEDEARVQAQRLRIGQCLCRRRDVHPAQELVDELDGLPIAHPRAAVHDARAHRVEGRAQLLEEVLGTSSHYQKISSLSPRHAPAHGRVQCPEATPGQFLVELSDRLWSDGAHHDHGRALRQCPGDASLAEENVVRLCRVRHHEDERLAAFRRFLRGGGARGPELDEGTGALGYDVEDL
jgi:hypothetical protein